jgi:hypothetical protein
MNKRLKALEATSAREHMLPEVQLVAVKKSEDRERPRWYGRPRVSSSNAPIPHVSSSVRP